MVHCRYSLHLSMCYLDIAQINSIHKVILFFLRKNCPFWCYEEKHVYFCPCISVYYKSDGNENSGKIVYFSTYKMDYKNLFL